MPRPVLTAFLLAGSLVASQPAAATVSSAPPELPTPPAVSAPAWALLDFASGRLLAGQEATRRIEPASMTKVMTAYLVFRAVREGTLALAGSLTPAAAVTRAGGSRMFVEPGRPVTVDALLFGLIVHSGNDAAQVLAEAVAGSEAAFVVRMNEVARELGLSASRFANVTGWPADDHYSTAADLATLTAALIRDFPAEYGRYFAERRYTHNGITQLNRNRLLWLDPTVDGVKTGNTQRAGFCLIASSRRGERRLIAVVAGASDEARRGRDALDLLNWGFREFDAVPLYAAGEAIAHLRIWYGARDTVAVGLPDRPLTVTVPRGQAARLSARIVSLAPLRAPVAAGQRLGSVRFAFGGEPWGEYPVYSLTAVPTAGLAGRLADTIRLWFRPQAAAAGDGSVVNGGMAK